MSKGKECHVQRASFYVWPWNLAISIWTNKNKPDIFPEWNDSVHWQRLTDGPASSCYPTLRTRSFLKFFRRYHPVNSFHRHEICSVCLFSSFISFQNTCPTLLFPLSPQYTNCHAIKKTSELVNLPFPQLRKCHKGEAPCKCYTEEQQFRQVSPFL